MAAALATPGRIFVFFSPCKTQRPRRLTSGRDLGTWRGRGWTYGTVVVVVQSVGLQIWKSMKVPWCTFRHSQRPAMRH